MRHIVVLASLLWFVCGDAAAATTSPVTLKMAVLFDTTFIERMDRFLEDFHSREEHIRIEQVCLPGFYQDDVVARHRAGESYDLLLVPDPAVPQFVHEGVLLPVLSNPTSPAARANLVPWALRACSQQGQTHAVPFIWTPFVVLCNPVLFEEENQPLPADDWTWQEFQRTADLMTTTTGQGKIYGASINTLWWSGWYPLLWTAGGQLEAYPQWTDSAPNQAALHKVFSLISNLSRSGALESTGDVAHFARGQTAMLTASANEVQYLREHGKPWVLRPLPQEQSTGIRRNGYGVAGFGIHSRSRHAPEAEAFLQYLTSVEAGEALVRAGFILPCHKAILQDPSAAPRLLGEEGSRFVQTVPDQQSPRFVDFLWAVDVMRSNLQAMLKHNLEPETAVRSLLFQLHDELDATEPYRDFGGQWNADSCKRPSR